MLSCTDTYLLRSIYFSVPDQHVSKSALWREIQLSAFNSMLTTAYAVSGASLLLMVQMHLLVRTSHASNSASSAHHPHSPQDHSGIFRELMEETFGPFFASGIQSLSQMNNSVIEEVFGEVEWTVEETLSVQFEDLREVMLLMKERVERGKEGTKTQTKELLSLLFLGANGHGRQSDDESTYICYDVLHNVL